MLGGEPWRAEEVNSSGFNGGKGVESTDDCVGKRERVVVDLMGS